VVGIISEGRTLTAVPDLRAVCDVVEVRLDQVGTDRVDWLSSCQKIEESGFPVILTLRLREEGGKWQGGDAQRRVVLESALRALSCVDIELASELCAGICSLAARLGKRTVVSYHNFEDTPSIGELREILSRILAHPVAIPKIVTMVNDDRDVATLEELLRSPVDRPVCVIGMGDRGAVTRMTFPALGSCLTYGYLDSPTAPGQWSAAALTKRLRSVAPGSEPRTAAQQPATALT
jgi:3-dehydroquinate dehydratase-1